MINYDPRMAAQRLLYLQGIPLREVPFDLIRDIKMCMRSLPDPYNSQIPINRKMDPRSAEVLRYSKYCLASIDPGPLGAFVKEMNDANLYGFEAVRKEMYRRLRWMTEEWQGVKKDKKSAEAYRRQEAVLRAYDAEIFRKSPIYTLEKMDAMKRNETK